VCCYAATGDGDGDGKNELRRAHLTGSLYRRYRGKLATRGRQEDTARRGEPRSSNTGITTAFSSMNTEDRSAATVRHRSRRDIRGQNARPRRVYSSALSRIPRRNSRLMQGPTRSRRIASTRRRLDLLIDRLLQLQHGQSHRNLSVYHGRNWSKIISSGATPANNDHQKSNSASYKTFMGRKALYKRKAIDDLSEQFGHNAFNVRRRRPPIDPMLLMVGIGRK